MPVITRKFEWDSGHRVLGHEGKCKNLHGHRYVAEVTVISPELDSLGRVIDFGVLKKLIGDWIDENWDHNFLCHPEDALVELWKISVGPTSIFAGKAPYVFPPGQNPTAENIAWVLFSNCVGLLRPHQITVQKVRVYETPNCWADHTAGGP